MAGRSRTLSALAFSLAAAPALFASGRASAQDLASAEFFLGENGALQLTVMASGAPRSCNEVSFAAIPGDAGHVIGRYNNGCANKSFSLARYAIDWDARTLTFVNLAFDTGGGSVAISKGDSVSTAYDATVMSYNGELWVAFECGGSILGAATASSCVGPMNAGTGVLDAARTNVVVLGNNSLGDGYLYSASVPELLSFNGTPYIYWSAVKIDAATPSTWANITGRGMQLVEIPASGGQLWNAQLGSWVGSADPAHTTEVWGLGASGADNAVADLQGVFTNGTDVFVTAGVAGTGCGNPFWPPSCYTFAVSKSASPLAADTFSNGTRLSASELPSNTHSYSRYIQDPHGQGYILGGYYTNAPGARPLPISGGPNGAIVTAFPIPSQSSYFQPLGGSLAFSTSGTTMANADGRLEAFVVGTNDSLYHAWQAAPGGSWSGWTRLATADPVSIPAAQRNADGRLEVFALGANRDVVHVWQTSAGGAWSGGWASLGGAANGGPTAERNADGTLDVFVVGTDGAVYHDRQTGAGGAWGGWVSLGGSAVGSPAVDPSGALVHTWQTTAGGGWNGAWASLGGVVTTPTVGRNTDGRLEAFAVGTDLAIYHAWQQTPGGAFSGWASLGGDFHGPSAQRNADGTLELLAVEFSGAVHHNVQTATGWSGWSSLGGGVLPYPFSSSDDDAPLMVIGDGGTEGGAGGEGTGGSTGAGGSPANGTGGTSGSGAGGTASSCRCAEVVTGASAEPLLALPGIVLLVRARRRRPRVERATRT